MSHEYDDNARGPRFLRNIRRPQPPVMRDRTQETLDTEAPKIAARHPNPRPRASFVDQFQQLVHGADEQMKEHAKVLEELRTTLAENAVLRNRCADLVDHVDKINDHWGEKFDRMQAERDHYSRLYTAIFSRLNGVVDFINATVDSAKKDAYAPKNADLRDPHAQGRLSTDEIVRQIGEHSTAVPENEWAAESH